MMCLKCSAIAVEGSDVCLAHGGREDDNWICMFGNDHHKYEACDCAGGDL